MIKNVLMTYYVLDRLAKYTLHILYFLILKNVFQEIKHLTFSSSTEMKV